MLAFWLRVLLFYFIFLRVIFIESLWDFMGMCSWKEGIQTSLLYLNSWNFETSAAFEKFSTALLPSLLKTHLCKMVLFNAKGHRKNKTF